MTEPAPTAHQQTTTGNAFGAEVGKTSTSSHHHHLPHLHHNSMNPDTSGDPNPSIHHQNPLNSLHHDSPTDFQPTAGAKHSQHTADSNIHQSSAAAPHGQGVSRVNTDGNIVQSDDPSTNPNAGLGKKLIGDVKGAWNGTIGSMEAATGAAIGNKNLEQRGLDKMQDEDLRLGAKAGVMPVGSERREGTRDA